MYKQAYDYWQDQGAMKDGGGALREFESCLGMRWGSTGPPGGDQVDGRPPVLNKLPTANGARRDKQEIDNLRCLRGFVLKFLTIRNMNRTHLKP